MAERLLCKDCMWVHFPPGQIPCIAKCTHESSVSETIVDYVHGKDQFKSLPCNNARSGKLINTCGPEAKYFKRKDHAARQYIEGI